MVPVYPLVRVTRGLVSVAVGRLMNGDYSQSGSALALSETLSATSDIVGILPYFGNMIWLLALWPTFTSIYHEVYLFNMDEKHTKELKFLAIALVLLTPLTIVL